jgi:hypothetical protein
MRALRADARVNVMPEFGSVERINQKFMCGLEEISQPKSLTADT